MLIFMYTHPHFACLLIFSLSISLLHANSYTQTKKSENEVLIPYKDSIRCKECNTVVSSANFFIHVNSPVAINRKENGMYPIKQIFKNQYNVFFEVISLSTGAFKCEATAYENFTFFPGYAWSSCSCPICGAHLGWRFYPVDRHCELLEKENEKGECRHRSIFYGIITSSIQTNTDLLLIAEKKEL